MHPPMLAQERPPIPQQLVHPDQSMSKLILINSTPEETRVALVENQALAEMHIERARDRGIAGNIYQGKVVRVLPGMQAAFVDIGLAKAGFLHVSDFYPGVGDLPLVDAELLDRDTESLADAPPEPIPTDILAPPPSTEEAPVLARIPIRSRIASIAATRFSSRWRRSPSDQRARASRHTSLYPAATSSTFRRPTTSGFRAASRTKRSGSAFGTSSSH